MKAAAATSALEKRIDELEREVNSLRRELDLSRRLLRAASQINSSLSLSQVVTRTLDNVQHSISVRRVALFLLEKSTEELLIVGARGLQQSTIHQLRYSEGEGIVGEAFKGKQLRVVTNASENADWLKGLEDDSDGKGDWLVLAPLVADEITLGVLCVEGADGQHTPNEETVIFLETIVSYAAAAIRNARLHED
ncbi:MAG TPA: GAF domain-containing protein, partial [Armatimonadetes bacterium]|nr:GAF domain-containing protein [Armatimonadota bacterium]